MRHGQPACHRQSRVEKRRGWWTLGLGRVRFRSNSTWRIPDDPQALLDSQLCILGYQCSAWGKELPFAETFEAGKRSGSRRWMLWQAFCPGGGGDQELCDGHRNLPAVRSERFGSAEFLHLSQCAAVGKRYLG